MKQTFCNHYNRGECQSCDWIELPYPEQLKKKEQDLRQALGFLGTLELEETVASPTLGFRNRAKLAVAGTIENPVIGITQPQPPHATQDLQNCPIHHPRINEILNALPEYIRAYNLIPYDIPARTGELKGVILFHSPENDQAYLRFVLRSKECVSRLRKLLPNLLSRFPSLKCVSANIQPIPHAILEGPEEVILTTDDAIQNRLGTVSLNWAPQPFTQTNSEIATLLYETAALWIKDSHATRVCDLFCGQGAFSFFAAQGAPEVKALLGIEINPDAIRSAARTALQSGLNHLQFKASDAAHIEADLSAFAPDLVLVNPPRRGLGRSLELILRQNPTHLIYSSCSHESLGQDLQSLHPAYRPVKARVFDMFPHTAHFETMIWLTR